MRQCKTAEGERAFFREVLGCRFEFSGRPQREPARASPCCDTPGALLITKDMVVSKNDEVPSFQKNLKI